MKHRRHARVGVGAPALPRTRSAHCLRLDQLGQELAGVVALEIYLLLRFCEHALSGAQFRVEVRVGSKATKDLGDSGLQAASHAPMITPSCNAASLPRQPWLAQRDSILVGFQPSLKSIAIFARLK